MDPHSHQERWWALYIKLDSDVPLSKRICQFSSINLVVVVGANSVDRLSLATRTCMVGRGFITCGDDGRSAIGKVYDATVCAGERKREMLRLTFASLSSRSDSQRLAAITSTWLNLVSNSAGL